MASGSESGAHLRDQACMSKRSIQAGQRIHSHWTSSYALSAAYPILGDEKVMLIDVDLHARMAAVEVLQHFGNVRHHLGIALAVELVEELEHVALEALGKGVNRVACLSQRRTRVSQLAR